MKVALILATIFLVGCIGGVNVNDVPRETEKRRARDERTALSMFPGGTLLGSACNPFHCTITIEYKGDVYTYDNQYQEVKIKKISGGEE